MIVRYLSGTTNERFGCQISMASIYNQSIHKSLNTSNTWSFEIIKQTHQTESLSHVWAQFTKWELRNTFTYIPRLLTKKNTRMAVKCHWRKKKLSNHHQNLTSHHLHWTTNKSLPQIPQTPSTAPICTHQKITLPSVSACPALLAGFLTLFISTLHP